MLILLRSFISNALKDILTCVLFSWQVGVLGENMRAVLDPAIWPPDPNKKVVWVCFYVAMVQSTSGVEVKGLGRNGIVVVTTIVE